MDQMNLLFSKSGSISQKEMETNINAVTSRISANILSKISDEKFEWQPSISAESNKKKETLNQIEGINDPSVKNTSVNEKSNSNENIDEIIAVDEDEVEVVDTQIRTDGAQSMNQSSDVITWICSVCDFKTESKDCMRTHLRVHDNPCKDCGRIFKTIDELNRHSQLKHTEVAYRNNSHDQSLKNSRPVCKFWLKGICNRGNSCGFSHGRNENKDIPKSTMCKFQENCRYGVRCKFVHNKIKPCLYQEKCRNERCNFYHFTSENVFLAKPNLKSAKEFPPLRSHKVPVWVKV